MVLSTDFLENINQANVTARHTQKGAFYTKMVRILDAFGIDHETGLLIQCYVFAEVAKRIKGIVIS